MLLTETIRFREVGRERLGGNLLFEGHVVRTGLEEVNEEMVRLGRIRIEAFVELKTDLTVWSCAGDFVVDPLLGPIITMIPLACDDRN